ncbi:hypothetical protein [Polyangium jinanense]|uniref:Uncharacterized protein n=1 Tax=Polyangium jinanense TaxID=2829994 RepID=A0A9X4AU35_9BACT|nr:hypothetical protein [Polyangium jinanense]MDC3954362.1 hypothetical protein [Polyangium jinanense]MDC3984186.1 hypothetical protein [Polyangium jinanense]
MSNRLNLFESMYDDQGQPAPFTRAELEPLEDLWEQRAALFFTPTSEIPERFVGSGELQVSLPIVTPSYGEFEQIPGYRNTRMWVDLLQRATGKIRWRPMDLPLPSCEKMSALPVDMRPPRKGPHRCV